MFFSGHRRCGLDRALIDPVRLRIPDACPGVGIGKMPKTGCEPHFLDILIPLRDFRARLAQW
jgi:hypothetical protein